MSTEAKTVPTHLNVVAHVVGVLLKCGGNQFKKGRLDKPDPFLLPGYVDRIHH